MMARVIMATMAMVIFTLIDEWLRQTRTTRYKMFSCS